MNPREEFAADQIALEIKDVAPVAQDRVDEAGAIEVQQDVADGACQEHEVAVVARFGAGASLLDPDGAEDESGDIEK